METDEDKIDDAVRAPLKLTLQTSAVPGRVSTGRRLVGFDVVSIHLGSDCALQNRVAGEFAAFADHHPGLDTFFDDPIELTGDPHAGERRVVDESQVFPDAIVDDRQPEPAAIGELIRHKVHRKLANRIIAKRFGPAKPRGVT